MTGTARVGRIEVPTIIPKADGVFTLVAILDVTIRCLYLTALAHICGYHWSAKWHPHCQPEARLIVDAILGAGVNFTQTAIWAGDFRELSKTLQFAQIDPGMIYNVLEWGERRAELKEAQNLLARYKAGRHNSFIAWTTMCHGIIGATSQMATAIALLQPRIHEVLGFAPTLRYALGYTEDARYDLLRIRLRSSVDATLKVIDGARGVTVDAKGNITAFIASLKELRQHTDKGYDRIEKNNRERSACGYLYSKASCRPWKLCGLIGGPAPISVVDVENLLRALE